MMTRKPTTFTRHRLGYFRTYDRLGGGGRGERIRPLPCYLEKQWSHRASRGGVWKLSTRSSQSILKILRLTLTMGSRWGQRSNFDVSVWWDIGPAISIAFDGNSAKVTSKGYLRYPVSISVILNMGHGQAQVTKGHQNKKKIGHAVHDLWSPLNVELKNEAILQSDSMQVSDRERSSFSKKVRFSNWSFRVKKMSVSEPVWSQDSKNAFLFLCDVWKCSKSGSEKITSSTDTVLVWGYVFAKNRYIDLEFDMLDAQAWFYNIMYVKKRFWEKDT